MAKIFRTATIVTVLIVLSAPSLFAHPSWGIVVSSTGIVYFSDLENVWKIDRDGKVSVFRPGVNGRHVHELSIDNQDNLYGPDYSYDPSTDKYYLGVWKMTPDGKQTQLQSPIESFMSGVGVCRDRTGNMYALEQNNNLKQKTLLLKRTPDGTVSTLAGSAFGYADGKGAAAKFSSVTAMSFGPDGNIYLTDGTGVRRVTLDGEVKTIAKDITARTNEDKPTLFGGNEKSIFGLAVDAGGSVYVADAGNRRLVLITKDGKLDVVYRVDPPYFPTGVFATPSGDVYVLEFSYTPPGTTDKPRVRKISSDGQNRIIGTHESTVAFGVMPRTLPARSRFAGLIEFVNLHPTYFVLLTVAVLAVATTLVWRLSRKQRT